jgi:hypothetical protein
MRHGTVHRQYLLRYDFKDDNSRFNVSQIFMRERNAVLAPLTWILNLIMPDHCHDAKSVTTRRPNAKAAATPETAWRRLYGAGEALRANRPKALWLQR